MITSHLPLMIARSTAPPWTSGTLSPTRPATLAEFSVEPVEAADESGRDALGVTPPSLSRNTLINEGDCHTVC